jgi:hypothetical protein
MAPRRIPTTLRSSVKSHGRVLRRATQSGGTAFLRKAPRSFFPLIKKIFQSIKGGLLPVPLTIAKTLLEKVIRSKDPERTVLQNGSGVISILASAIPALLTVVPEIVNLFKRKKRS